MSERSAHEADDLLAHAGWVRALAARLARDESEADDVAQDTLAAALEHPPRKGGAMRPWLGRVLGNALRGRRRGERRRADHESRAAGWSDAESSQGEPDLLEQLEQQQALGALVRSLDEPYRSVILARYYRGESALSIARRTGRPAATVRSQLVRGRELLRRRLVEREGGDGRAARALLLAAARGPELPQLIGTTTTLLTLSKGALAVNTSTKLVAAGIAAAAVVGALIGFDSFTVRAEPETAATPDPESVALVEPRGQNGEELAVVEAAGERAPERALAPTPAEAPTAPPVEAEVEPMAVVTARAIDAHGGPIAGAVLRYADERRDKFHDASEPAGEDGRVELMLPEGALMTWGDQSVPTTYAIEAAGHGAHFFLASALLDATTDFGDVELGPGGRVSGFVLDARNQPVVGAEVLVADVHLDADLESARLAGPSRGLGLPAASTGVLGGFLVPFVAKGPARVWARSGDGAWTFSDAIEVSRGFEVGGIILTLGADEESGLITGRVVDPDGEPVAGVPVSYTAMDPFSFGTKVDTDAAGEFSISPQSQSAHLLVAKDKENRWRAASNDGVLPGDRIELKLVAPDWMEVAVVDQEGEPVPKASINLRFNGLMDSLLRQVVPREDGTWGVIVPEKRFYLDVYAQGFDSVSSAQFEPGLAPSAITLEMRRQPMITGRVTGDGKPIAGAKVQVAELFDRYAVRTEGFQMHYDLNMGNRAKRTDSDGRFAVPAGSPRGDSFLVVIAEGWALTEWGPIAKTATELKDIEIELTSGGSIRGRLRLVNGQGGRDPGGQLIAATRGDGFVLSMRAEEDGSFGFEHLTPGPWRVEHRMREHEKSWSIVQEDEIEEVEWNCVVHEGEVTRLDLDGIGEVALRGRLTVDGVGAVGWSATIELRDAFKGERPSRAALLDSDGRFELQTDPGGYRLELRSPGEDGDAITVITEELVLSELEHSWEHSLELSTIEGRMPGAETLRFEVGTVERQIATVFDTAPDGTFRGVVPAGMGWLKKRSYQPQRFTNWENLQSFKALAGETVQVDLE